MSKIFQSLEQAVEEYNKLNPKTPLVKHLSIPTISFRTTQSDEGEIVDSDSWETCTVKMNVYPEERLEGAFLSLRQSRQISRGFMKIILMFNWIDPDHGFCVHECDTSSQPDGLDIKVSDRKKISAEEALEIINAKTHWLRFREGTTLKLPSVANFKMS